MSSRWKRFRRQQEKRRSQSAPAIWMGQGWAVLLLLAAAPGCAMIAREGPVPKQVATSRQLSQRGASAIDRNDWTSAETLLAEAVKACPVDVEARRHYAETLWHRGAALDGIAQMDEAVRLAPEDPALCIRSGEMHLAAGHIEDARHRAETALSLSLQSPAAWGLRARVNSAANLLDAALADAQRALCYQKNDPALLLFTAEVYRKMNRPQRALSTLETLADTYPPGEEPRQVLFLQGLALAALGRPQDAAEAYIAAMQKEEPSAELLFRLAEAQLAAGDRDDAALNVQRALARDPQHAASLSLLDQLRQPIVAQNPAATRR